MEYHNQEFRWLPIAIWAPSDGVSGWFGQGEGGGNEKEERRNGRGKEGMG